MRTKLKWAFLAAGAALAVAGCAGEVVDIDRTGPSKTDKAILTGEWYYRPTVVEVQYNQGLLFEGLMGDMERVRWDIREHQLIAYRSYQLLEEAEDGNGAVDFHGNPVAIFAVTSHFDVVREYNPATGEQTNVIVENTTDRPWYERKYMRVDWSTNLLTEPVTVGGYVQATAAGAYYYQEHEVDNPYRAEVTATNINVVNNYTLMTDFETCYYTFFDPMYCGSSQAKLKLSFLRVDQRGYASLQYPDGLAVVNEETGRPFLVDHSGRPCDGPLAPSEGAAPIGGTQFTNQEDCTNLVVPMFERFGYFRTQRFRYDHEHQWTRDNRLFFINRWNIWKDTFKPNGAVVPTSDRDTRQIVYYTNVDFPVDRDIWSATANRDPSRGKMGLVADWDRAFKKTVGLLQGRPADQVDNIFVVKRNTCNVEGASRFAAENGLGEVLKKYGISQVTQGDLKRACSVLEYASNGRFSWQKPGDLRHAFLHWVDTPQVAGPLGYGPSSADPVTGEIVSAVANIYGAAIDSYAAYAADVVSVMNGKIDLEEVIDGENIRTHMARKRAGAYGPYAAAKLDAVRAARKRDAVGVGAQAGGEAASASEARALSRAKLEKLKGTALARELLASDDLVAAMAPGNMREDLGAAAQDSRNPVGWVDELTGKHRQTMMDLAKHSIMMASWSDDGMASLAHELRQLSWQEVYAWMRRELYRGVMAHEVGHTLGLRHNFEGSMDPLNYPAEFWQSYDPATGEVRRVGADGQATPAERYMYSSIMDYDARFYADSMMGIGPYDVAAIKFGYGQLVEVFDEEAMSGAFAYDQFYDYALEYLLDYRHIPFMLSESGRSAIIAGIQWKDSYLSVEELTEMEGVLPAVENLWKRHHVSMEELVKQTSQKYHGEREDLDMSPVPYRFCPDERAWATNVTCQPYDKGGNLLEAVQDRIERHDKYYFFTNFRRDRVAFDEYRYASNYMSRIYSRYFSPLVDVYRGWQWWGSALEGTPRGDVWAAASIEGLNYLTSVLQQPEPGRYCLGADGVYHRARRDTACEEAMEIALGDGKYFNTRWTHEYNYKATRLGTFYDKWVALVAMTENAGSFYRDFGDLLDAGAFSLSYWRAGGNSLVSQEEVLEIFRPAFLGGVGPYAWRANGTGGISWTPVVDIYENTPDLRSLPGVEPATSWTLKYWSILLPMALFNSFYDYTEDFSFYVRTCIKGYSDCYDVEEGGVTQFTDPLTQYTYVAPNSNSADPTTPAPTAIGALLLRRAQALADAYSGAKSHLQEVEEACDAGPDPETGEDPAECGEVLEAEFKAEKAKMNLNETTSLVDIVRQLSHLMEFGG